MDDPDRTGADQPASVDEAPAGPRPRIGRFWVERVLGQGGFGVVYLAHDDQLHRPVAIKVPHRRLVSRPEDAAAYLAEARTVAHLDHPNIVPVYDVGSTEDCPCFIVSKFIEGSTLAKKVREDRPSVFEAAELVATVAETLHYAHRRGVFHRDVKPGNILLDADGKPHVADFGLALREEDVGKGPRYAGTPAYMSPEQARGEGHRVDGRSDLFSLGAVFYELLTGRRPFRADSREELLELIATHEPRPPRQWDDAIPKELERICLKLLSKRAAERYPTAGDLADDLRHFLATASGGRQPPDAATCPVALPHQGADAPRSPATTDAVPLRIVPKGLRAFDAHDADFFLELLPGPRDREGLPDSIRFWKTRIEERDADATFAVGLLYGPSGCGKSSLVKAGLLPRLSEDVRAVYVEATPEDTETRLLHGLRKRCPALPSHLALKEALAAVRRGQGLPTGQKVLLVLDQFEQWPHARRAGSVSDRSAPELVQALRQCDGGRVQALVLVRDDFWLAVSRFLKELEVRLVEGQNSALVDLFDPEHARKVLAAFGRAFGRLPEKPAETGREQQEFLDQAVSGLAEDGKVVCVRLALFAEMMKGKAWTPAALRAVGGTEGVGVTFLDETFSAGTAPPEHRYHQKVARAVLKALLPESGTDIKGAMRSHAELLAASGYAQRPKEFDELLRILDGEVRLLTPTDLEGQEGDTLARSASEGRYYQLTHDYLVPALRAWLTRKQKETRRGRAELLLADRAAVWGARPENRQLPSPWQWLQIRTLTRPSTWTPSQRQMMRRATRYHIVRGLLAAAALALLGWGAYEGHGTLQAEALRGRLLDANTNEVPAIVREMPPYRRWLDRRLRESYAQAEMDHDRRKQLHAGLALLPVHTGQVEYLYGRLLDAEPDEVPVIRDALASHQAELVDRLWAVVEQSDKDKEAQRLRAAAALARYDPDSPRWDRSRGQVVADLVAVNAVYLGRWGEALRPVKARLLEPLAEVFRDRRPERTAERVLAANLLADYAADQPPVLTDLLLDADDKQFAVLYPTFQDQAERGLSLLTAEVDRQLPAEAKDADREKLVKRQANAAVSLLRLNQPDKVWPLLRHRPDPRVRSYLIHRFGPLGADAGALVRRLAEEPDLTIRRALLLGLGEFGEGAWKPEEKKRLVGQVQELYRTAADPGLHAAAEWLLRQWHEEAWLLQTDAAWARDKEQRAQRLEMASREASAPGAKPQWYVNGQGQTMVVIPGPVEFLMGSPPTEADRRSEEGQHRRSIGRTFALAATPVTKEQFRRFLPGFSHSEIQRYPEPTCPIGGVVWYEAAAYCNWLSDQEGIPRDQWCYETNARGQVTRLKANYLSLTGYRLPTEAEWEYGCRAGAVTSRSYGETEELLDRYAWYFTNAHERTWPVGSKKPNDLGLFDLHGNVCTWCQESYQDYPGRKALPDLGASTVGLLASPSGPGPLLAASLLLPGRPAARGDEVYDDKEDVFSIDSNKFRVLRGGSCRDHASFVRCANRVRFGPATRYDHVGLRPARTSR
jgi:formylglycine-generating enzyme required for sulfatase activity